MGSSSSKSGRKQSRSRKGNTTERTSSQRERPTSVKYSADPRASSLRHQCSQCGDNIHALCRNCQDRRHVSSTSNYEQSEFKGYQGTNATTTFTGLKECSKCRKSLRKESASRKFITCTACGCVNCTLCLATHEGMSCSEYQNHVQSNEESRKCAPNESESCSRSDVHIPNMYPQIPDELRNPPEVERSTENKCSDVSKQSEISDASVRTRKKLDHGPKTETFRKDYALAELTTVSDKDAIFNAERFVCPVCRASVEESHGLVLKKCLHELCRPCFKRAVENSATVHVRCPVYVHEERCCGTFEETEIKTVVSLETYKRHVDVGAAGFRPQTVKCNYRNCDGSGTVDANEEIFFCTKCQNVNCIPCDTIHDTMTCDEYQSSLVNKVVTAVAEVLDKVATVEDNLVEALENDFTRNRMAFDCFVCYIEIPVGEGVILKSCLHGICRDCFIAAVENSAEQLVRCPVIIDDVPCPKYIEETEIKAVVSNPVYKKHIDAGIKCAGDVGITIFHCSTDNCSGSWYIDRSVEFYVCPECNRRNCVACKAVHDNITCAQYIARVLERIDKGLDEDPQKKRDRFLEQLRLYERDYVENVDPFMCEICLSTIDRGGGIILQNCHHQFCKECLTEHIRNFDKTKVVCPAVEGDSTCSMEINDREIKGLLPAGEYQQRVERGLSEAERSMSSYHCKTVNCPGWCTLENVNHEVVQTFLCPCCKKRNCLQCDVIHEKMTCTQYQKELRDKAQRDVDAKTTVDYLEKQIRKGDAMRCPKCGVIIFKRGGCDGFKCTACNVDICWATKGLRWGPGGEGDTSGGCGCDFSIGKRCHPQCQYCH